MILSLETQAEIEKDAEAIGHMLGVGSGHVELHFKDGKIKNVVTVDRSLKFNQE